MFCASNEQTKNRSFFSKSKEYVIPVGVTFPLKCNINKLTNVAGCFNHFSMPPAYFDGYQVQAQVQNSAFVCCIFTRISQLWNITVKLWKRREKSKYNSLFCWLNHKKCIKHYDWNKQGNAILCSLMQAKMGFIEEHVWYTVQNNKKKITKRLRTGKKQQKPNNCRENCEYSAFKWLINGYKVKFGVKTKWYHRIVLPAHKYKHNCTPIIIHSNDPLFLVCCISFSMIISLVYAHRRSFSHIFYWLHIIFAINIPRMDLKNYWIWCDYMILAHIVDHVCGC